jgi:hypothetical protein
MPLVDAIHNHVFAAARIRADDTTVPVLAKGKTRTGRLWTYVCATTARLPGQIRRRPYSSTRLIVGRPMSSERHTND